MKLRYCPHREQRDSQQKCYECRHPQVHSRGGWVTAEICLLCRRLGVEPSSSVPVRTAEGDLAGKILAGPLPPLKRGPRTLYECDVVIPYHHNLQWVPEAIDSVLWQCHVRPLIHLVNDQSPEPDGWLRRKYQGHANIHWYRNLVNLGPYRSVHQVWQFMKSPYFAVQDSDDLSYPNRLWLSIQALEDSGAEILGASLEQFVEPALGQSGEKERKFVEFYPIWYSGQKWPTGCPHGILINGTVVMRRSLFEWMNGYHDLMCGGDVEFCTRIHYAGVRRYIADAVVGARRANGKSLSRGGKYAMGQPARTEIIEHLNGLYPEYERPGFDPRRYGCLDRADPALTVRLTSP